MLDEKGNADRRRHGVRDIGTRREQSLTQGIGVAETNAGPDERWTQFRNVRGCFSAASQGDVRHVLGRQYG